MNRRQLLTTLGGSLAGTAIIARSGSAAKPHSSEEWPTFQYENGRSGYHPDAHGPRNNIVEEWRTRGGGPWAPAVANDLVYSARRVARAGRMKAYNVEDGSVEWSTIMEGNTSPSAPTVVNEAVHQADTDGNFYAFDAETGEKQWRFTADGDGYSFGSLAANGLLYFEIDDVVYAVTQTDGEEIWKLETQGFSAMATDGDIIYMGAGYGDSNLLAVDATSGEVLWDRRIADRPGNVTVVEGVVYAGTRYMAAFDATDGSRLWRFDARYVTNSAAVAHGLVYFGTTQNHMYAVDKDTGRERWRFTVGEARFDGINSSPAVVGNLVYFGSYDKHIYALNAHSGRERWSYNTGEEITGSPAVVNGRVHIPTRLSGLITVASKSRPKNPSRR